MNPWTFLLPTLFNFAVIIFIVGLWFVFVRNFIREVRKGKQRTQNKWAQQAKTQQNRRIEREPSVSTPSRNRSQSTSTRTRTRQQPRRNSTSWQNTNARNTSSFRLRDLMKYKPADLYRLLKEHLPAEYKEELQNIFNSPNAEVELIKFIRRPDVWPTVQKTLAKISSGTETTQRNSKPMVSKKQAVAVQETYQEEFIDLDWLDREDAELQSEYDSLVDEFDEFMGNISGSDVTEPEANTSTSSRYNKTRHNKEVANKKWLKEAVIANVILERPDF